ncbi:MAG: MCP four helix bundle domain-containing protein, partial [Campylobacter hyointestinalis]
MGFFDNLKVSSKLYLSFAVIIILMIIVSVIGIGKVKFIDESLSVMNNVNS